ncbi:hypothetical protein CUJ83_09385 [Methanocella sp. CWC-04]|uniref:Uncharacterized protein n=1 Tax=Methanooceanicella nereidis TaxID=2052831 RepID=A0AAP2RDE4_9EURY|nr:hypothetical protein [Methanocella sp. CWC-04]MCD1295209.1 hypothetical protein [Methanocella sp. CWC-04]
MIENVNLVVLISFILDVVLVFLFIYNLSRYYKAKFIIKDDFTRNLITNILGMVVVFTLTFLDLWFISLGSELEKYISIDIIDLFSILMALVANLTLLYVAYNMYCKSVEVGFDVS